MNFLHPTKKSFLVLSLFFCLFLGNCAHKDEKSTAELDYLKAYELLKDRSFEQAAQAFEKINDDYPASKWAEKSQTMAVYAYFKNEDYEKLAQLVDFFANSYPNSEYLPYMLYMRALGYYLRIPDIERAQDETQKASYGFRELIARFPVDEHSSDAKEKLEFIDEHLAGAKMSVGRYQLQNGNYVGAFQNFEEVVIRYRDCNQVPEALFRIAEIHHKLGDKKLAEKALQKLREQFPATYWSKLDITK